MKELTALQKAAINSINKGIISLNTKRSKKQAKIDLEMKEIEALSEEIDKNKALIESYAECSYEELFPQEVAPVQPDKWVGNDLPFNTEGEETVE